MRGEGVWTNWIKTFTQNYFTRASWPSSPSLATFQEACWTIGFLDFVDLYLFRANISDLYPPNFILLICSMQHLVKYCQCYGSAYHCFSTFECLDFVDLYLFRAYISDLYPPNFFLLICSMQHLVKYCQCYGSAYHCFSTFWTSGTLQSLQLTSPIICIFRWDLWKMNAVPSPITFVSFRPQGRITQSQPLNFHLSW